MAEKGQVIELKNNLAVVRMRRTEACAKCRACLAGMTEKDMIVEAENMCDAQVDDWVEIEIQTNGFLYAVLVMYGLPFVAFIVGVLGAYFLFAPSMSVVSGDLLSFGVGIVFMLLAFLWIRSQEHRWEDKKYRPRAVRLTEEGYVN